MDPLHRGLERVSGRMEGSNKKARGARGEIKGEVERGASRCALWLGMRGTRRFGIMNSGDVTSLGGGRTVAAAPRAVEGAVEALASIGPDGVDARRRIFALVCASCALVDVCMWRSTQQCVCMWWRNDNRMGGVSPSRRVHTHTDTRTDTTTPSVPLSHTRHCHSILLHQHFSHRTVAGAGGARPRARVPGDDALPGGGGARQLVAAVAGAVRAPVTCEGVERESERARERERARESERARERGGGER